MNAIWYFGLEPIKSRYTKQLSEVWMPKVFSTIADRYKFMPICPAVTSEEIKKGSVLDATGRGLYAMQQCQMFLKMIEIREVKDGDVIYLQDFWTAGIESIFYAAHLYGLKLRYYATNFAQSVDEYDFTAPMKRWMRHIELGIDSMLDGMFVASTVHKKLLRDAGFCSKIHVIGLPIDQEDVMKDRLYQDKQNRVVYSSRLDTEKNPMFMLEVARKFLKQHSDWTWTITTSSSELRSNDPDVISEVLKLNSENPRFIINVGSTKEEYYNLLEVAKIQFNSALQDFVSWTLLEAECFDCMPVYPRFNSFIECVDKKFTYKPFCVESAVLLLNRYCRGINEQPTTSALEHSSLGQYIIPLEFTSPFLKELNVWHEKEYITRKLLQYDILK